MIDRMCEKTLQDRRGQERTREDMGRPGKTERKDETASGWAGDIPTLCQA